MVKVIRRKRLSLKRKSPLVRKPSSRRRLQPAVAGAVAGGIYYIGKKAYNSYKAYQQAKRSAQYISQSKAYKASRKNYDSRLAVSDNIITAPAFKIGTPRQISFEEKVSKITHPPVIYKRQYAWSAEGASGRKSWFQIPINHLLQGLTGGGLYDDIMTTNSARMSTNTSTPDPTIIFSGDTRTQQSYYIDYESCKLRMINSSTNALTGKLSLIGYKRDCDTVYYNTTCPMTPLNLMAFSKSGVGAGTTTASNVQYAQGQEATIGNGFFFNDTTANSDYDANLNMPGSSINATGSVLNTDPSLGLFSADIKDFTGYWFKEINSYKFSLKPGQQFNHFSIFNDLPHIKREGVDMTYLKGVSFFLVVEFEGQIVGDNTAFSSTVSTGSSQLSCIYEEKRVVGVHGKLRSQLFMGTAPLSIINKINQVTINPDTGTLDVGEEEDTD